MKQTIMQWLKDPNQSNIDNPNCVICEASRHFRNKKMEHLKGKTDELQTNSKNKNIRDLYRGINDFRRVTSLILIEYRVRRVICLQTPTVFWLGRRIISVSYGMCMDFMMLGRLQYIQKTF